jgi:mRNA interferase RelE/StbE
LKVLYNKKFLKDLSLIPLADRKRIEDYAFERAPKIKSFRELQFLEKLKGYSNFYKIRVGNYRVGVQFEHATLIFERVLHRKEIYRYFPE